MKHNMPNALLEWVYKSTEDVGGKRVQALMRQGARKIISKGGLRGNISEYFVSVYPETRPKLKDLYL